ncbi:WSC-domain-containing protein [Multifurca ochricompacta]|uniref:WSC-domain-containing protein n=1 Tax=Multifurca ochricompacta TaxID=376703 RepID=A0AAD4LZB7_9AGAM|nr:WSC-domain-containing protein [Multifurca ochricompacta]
MKQLALFVSISFTLSAFAFNQPTIPLNWTTQYACAVDVPSRILANVVTTQYTDNMPASCIQRCDAAGFSYAGVEYSNECHCGTGLVGTPASAPVSDCNMTCTGDPTLSCGGSWRIQIYKSPALPPGWWGLQGCYLDTPDSPTFGSPIAHHTIDTNLDPINQCVPYCAHIGYPWFGVENGTDCQCSFGLAPGAQLRSQDECTSICPPPPGEGNENCGGFQRMLAYRFRPF